MNAIETLRAASRSVPNEDYVQFMAAVDVVHYLLEALERIARPHDCGCKPCTGACRNQLALEITVEEIQELARAAIAKAKGESDGR